MFDKIKISLQLAVVLSAWTLVSGAGAETLNVSVNAGGKPVDGAVVYAMPVSAKAVQSAAKAKSVVDQIDKEYVARITPIRTGTAVTFPNHDNIRHHVYSFSPANTFEIPLYLGVPREPIMFDKPGVVTLGCNIHDWMSAYIYVVDTPYFASADGNGKARLDLPPGDYDVAVWYPNIKKSAGATKQQMTVQSGKPADAAFAIEMKKVWKPRRGPISSRSGGGGYR